MSTAVWQFKLLCERKLSKPNQGPFVTVLDKNIVIFVKFMCEIHAYRIDDQGHLTLEHSMTTDQLLIIDVGVLSLHYR